MEKAGCVKKSSAGQVLEEQARLTDTIGTLENRINQLEDILVPVMRQTIPDEKGDAECRTELVPVAEAISTSRRRIENLIEHVVSVIDRVELPK